MPWRNMPHLFHNYSQVLNLKLIRLKLANSFLSIPEAEKIAGTGRNIFLMLLIIFETY